jgi:hypothetical protein
VDRDIAEGRKSVNGKLVVGLAAVLLSCVSANIAVAGVARSANYSLDYAISSAGGGVSQSATYSSVSVLLVDGPDGILSSSTNYRMGSVVGMSDSPTVVADWSLY